MVWEEEVKFNTDTDEEEQDSIEHCKTSYYTDYKYNIFYEVGKEFTKLDKNLDDLVNNNELYALSNKLKEEQYKINKYSHNF